MKKGQLERQDSYSGFGTGIETTTLLDHLKEKEITEIFCVGLAYDYCVGSTALDGVKNQFRTTIIRDGTKSVAAKSAEEMQKKLE